MARTKTGSASSANQESTPSFWRSLVCCVNSREVSTPNNTTKSKKERSTNNTSIALKTQNRSTEKQETSDKTNNYVKSDSGMKTCVSSDVKPQVLTSKDSGLNSPSPASNSPEPVAISASGDKDNMKRHASTDSETGDQSKLLPDQEVPERKESLNSVNFIQNSNSNNKTEKQQQKQEVSSAATNLITQVSQNQPSLQQNVHQVQDSHTVPISSSSDQNSSAQQNSLHQICDRQKLVESIGINFSPYPVNRIPGQPFYGFVGEPTEENLHRKCLLMDLDETLVHSSFHLVENPDFIVEVEIDNSILQVYVKKRPGVDAFLVAMSELYECVLFTASLNKYADPVSDFLDPTGKVFGNRRLFREQCVNHNGSYIKDISRIGRPLPQTILLDNCSVSYMFQPDNGIPTTSWFDDPTCTELSELIEPLRVIASAENVYAGIRQFGGIQKSPFYQRNPHLWQHQQEFYNVGQFMNYNHIQAQQQAVYGNSGYNGGEHADDEEDEEEDEEFESRGLTSGGGNNFGDDSQLLPNTRTEVKNSGDHEQPSN